MMNINKMMKQVQDMQSKLADVQGKIAETEFEGRSGGGMVKVTFRGRDSAVRVMIDDKNFSDPANFSEDLRVVEDLIVAAINDVVAKVNEESTEQMKVVTGGIPLPPGLNNLF